MKKFTLLELLIVISILGILLTLLLPSLSQAREKAITIVCVNNMKSLSTATQLYLSDNNSFYAGHNGSTTYWHGQRGTGWYWSQDKYSILVKPHNLYLGDDFIEGDIVEATRCPKPSEYFSKHGTDYYYNGYNEHELNLRNVRKATKINEPSRMVLFVEEGAALTARGANVPNVLYKHHSDNSFPLIFVDGHAKMKVKITPDLRYTPSYTFRNDL